MSALETARQAAADAAAKLAKAEQQEQAEQAEQDARNAAKRAAYWQGEGRELAIAQGQRVVDARADFRDAVAKGDGADVLTAYLTYRRVEVEAAAFTRAAADATRRTINQGTLDERTTTDVQAMDPRGLPFGDLLERTLRDLGPTQGSDYASRKLASLTDSLESV